MQATFNLIAPFLQPEWDSISCHPGLHPNYPAFNIFLSLVFRGIPDTGKYRVQGPGKKRPSENICVKDLQRQGTPLYISTLA